MIDASYVRTMAQYNTLQNTELYQACDTLTDAERLADRGAFFGSIQRTLSHVLWADMIWFHRLAATPEPPVATISESAGMIGDWDDLKTRRSAMDATITACAQDLTEARLAQDLTWFSASLGREFAKPLALVLVHVFNHQTHHRGQAHAMLTAAKGPSYTTDLIFGSFAPPPA